MLKLTPYSSGLVACAVMALAADIQAATYFDGSFNLGDYDITSYTQASSVAVSQSSSGNPGLALSEVVSVPPPVDVDRTASYFLNRNFSFDPAAQVQPFSISFSLDKSVSFSPSNVIWGNGQGFVVSQGGRLYEVDAALPSNQGVFQTASVTATSLLSFAWISDPAKRVLDPSSHPSLSGGLLTFGFYNGLAVPPGYPAEQVSYLMDNFSVTISAVPEPPAWPALGAGAAWMLLRRRMRPAWTPLATSTGGKR